MFQGPEEHVQIRFVKILLIVRTPNAVFLPGIATGEIRCCSGSNGNHNPSMSTDIGIGARNILFHCTFSRDVRGLVQRVFAVLYTSRYNYMHSDSFFVDVIRRLDSQSGARAVLPHNYPLEQRNLWQVKQTNSYWALLRNRYLLGDPAMNGIKAAIESGIFFPPSWSP